MSFALVPCSGGFPGCSGLVRPGRTCRYCKVGDPPKRIANAGGRYVVLPLAPVSQKASGRNGPEVGSAPQTNGPARDPGTRGRRGGQGRSNTEGSNK